MNREQIKKYIDLQPIKVVSKINLATNKITYTGIKQYRDIQDITGDEELVRAYIITRLVNELGYSPDRIEIEYEYTAGRPHTITSRIDIIVRDTSNNAFLFIELKSPTDYNKEDKDKIIEEQLFKLAGMERTEGRNVKYLVLYTANDTSGLILDECILIDNEKFPTFVEW